MRYLLLLISSFVLVAPITSGSPAPNASGPNMQLQFRTRVQPFPGSPAWTEASFDETIPATKSAIIITDMWDKHWCKGATKRVGEIAQRMEPFLEKARSSGMLIIHAPSDTMEFYAKAPGRLLAENAPHSALPPERTVESPPLPIDDSDGGCDTAGDKEHTAWTRETSTLSIAKGDVISDNGAEIYNILKQRHIDTVFFMGVHANKCILNRSFGIRQLSKWGVRCILVRDLTDAMYNPASKPYVSHAAGVDLVVQYIEKYAAPTVTSRQMLAALSGGISTSPHKPNKE